MADRTVIIPSSEQISYYIPQFLKIDQGDNVRWINKGQNRHKLFFYIIGNNGEVETLFSLVVRSGGTAEHVFDFDYKSINYTCQDHPGENNSIVILKYAQRDMSNTERLRYLSQVFNIKPPEVWKHLDYTK